MPRSGSPVFAAALLFFPRAGYVPFVDLGVFAVILDTAGVFAVEFSPVKVDVGVIGFLGDFDTGIGVGAVVGSAVEFHIFCLQGGVVRVVRYHELAVVAAKLRALEFKTCAVAEGEQIQILLCGAVEAVALAVHIDVYFSAFGDLKAAFVVQALYIVVEFEALLGVGDQVLTFFENSDVEVFAAVDALRPSVDEGGAALLDGLVAV